MRRALSSPAIGLLLAGLAAGQTTTISPKGAVTAGNGDNSIPYSMYPTRYQQLYDYDSFTHGLSLFTARAVHYRMHSKYANGKYGGQTIEISMWMANAPAGTTSTSFSTTFDSNVDPASKKRVIDRRKFQLPVLTTTSFDIKFPFDTPNTFTITPPLRRSVILEVVVWGNSVGNSFFGYPIDAAGSPLSTGTSRLYAYDTVPGGGRYRQQGTYAGCANRNQRVVTQYADPGKIMVGGSGGNTYAYGWIQNIPAVGVLGARPLNVTLPGTSCKLMQDLVALFPGIGTGSTGRYQLDFTIPNLPTLGGVKFLFQTLFADPQANGFGWVSTRGIEVTIGDGKPVPPDQFKLATGSSTGYGLVTQFVQ